MGKVKRWLNRGIAWGMMAALLIGMTDLTAFAKESSKLSETVATETPAEQVSGEVSDESAIESSAAVGESETTTKTESPESMTEEPKAELPETPKEPDTSEPATEPEVDTTKRPEAEITEEPETEATKEPETTEQPETGATKEPETTEQPETGATKEPETEATKEPETEATEEPEPETTEQPKTENPETMPEPEIPDTTTEQSKAESFEETGTTTENVMVNSGNPEQTEWLFDFGSTAVPDGWIAVGKDDVYSADKGYGWSGADTQPGSANTSSKLTEDAFNGKFPALNGLFDMAKDSVKRGSNDFEFVADIPAGTYDVMVYGGWLQEADASKTVTYIIGEETYTEDINIFGSVEAKGIEVAEGESLRLAFTSGDIAGLKVIKSAGSTDVPVNPDQAEWKFDFGSTAVPDGWIAVGKDDVYSADKGYGWSGADTQPGSANTSNKLTESSFHEKFPALNGLFDMAKDSVKKGSNNFEFVADIPAGTYNVMVYGGWLQEADASKTVTYLIGESEYTKTFNVFDSVEAKDIKTAEGEPLKLTFTSGDIAGLVIQKVVQEPEDVHVAVIPDGVERKEYYTECFDDAGALDSKGLPVGWKTAGVIDESVEAGERSIKTDGARSYYYVDASGNSPRYAGQVLTELSKTGWIEYDFKFEEVTDATHGIGLGFLSGSVNSGAASIRGTIMPNGDVKFYNGSSNITVANIKDAGWVHFVYEFNNNTKQFAVKITDAETGELIGKTTEAFSYNNTSGQVGSVVFNISAKQSAKFSVDEIRVYGYPTPFEFLPEIEGGLPQTGKVELTDSNPGEPQNGYYILKNDYCMVYIDKKTAVISKYYTREGNEICGNSGDGSYLLNYTDSLHNEVTPETKPELTLKNCAGTIIRQTDDYCEVSVKETRIKKEYKKDGVTPNPSYELPIDLDFRFVLKKDSPGLYMYAVLDEDGLEDGRSFNFGQSRYAIKFDYDRFSYSAIQGGEIGGELVYMPGPGDFNLDIRQSVNGNGQLFDSTYVLNDGSIFTKYNNLSYQYCSNMVGAFSEQGCIALLTPGRDWAGGGYAKQDIDTHGGTGNAFTVNWHLETGHNGTQGVDVESGYRKIYGPVMWYATTDAESKEDAYNKAYAQAQKEMEQWPYAWVEDEDYAAATRGSLKGVFSVKNGTVDTEIENDLTVTDSVKGKSVGWAVLSDERSKYWALDNDYYEFYAPVWSDGTFEIKDIIPGTYKLNINVNGVMDEYVQHNVVIGTNEAKDLGSIVWDDPVYGETLWTIGTPDKTAEEYAYAKPIRYWGSHLLFNDLFPDGVDFKVGESDVSRDWFFVQMASQTAGHKEHYDGALYYDEISGKVKYDASRAVDMAEDDPRWRGNELATYRIRFDSDVSYGEGKATLLINVCGNRFGTIRALLNGTNIIDASDVSKVSVNGGQMTDSGGMVVENPADTSVISLYTDGSVGRSGLVGINQLVKITFDASLIQAGENIITLTHDHPAYKEDNKTSWENSDYTIYAGNIYDAIRLDVDAEAVKEETADKTRLQNLYDENVTLKEEDYTAETWKDFHDAMNAAKQILDDAEATQNAVDLAYKTLYDAAGKLVKVETSASPKPSEEPGASASPNPSEEPGTSASPNPSEEPGASASPNPSEEPGTSTSPNPSEEPGTSTSPNPSEEPGTSASPNPTEKPETSASPNPSEEPGTSASPNPSEEPGTSASPNPTTAPPADVQHKLAIDNGISKVPPAFANDENLNTPEKIETQMKLNIQKQTEGIALENIAVYDVVLMVNIDGTGWQTAGKENFPENGLTVTLPYPEGTGGDTHDFVVCHLFTEDINGHYAGETEYPEVTKTAEGIRFKVYGLSPISVGWKQIIPVNDESGSDRQEEAVNESRTAVSESPKTSDNNHIGWYIFAMILSASLFGVICFETYRRKKR